MSLKGYILLQYSTSISLNLPVCDRVRLRLVPFGMSLRTLEICATTPCSGSEVQKALGLKVVQCEGKGCKRGNRDFYSSSDDCVC